MQDNIKCSSSFDSTVAIATQFTIVSPSADHESRYIPQKYCHGL